MNEPTDLRLQRYLRDLPQAAPPAALGARILARHRARRRLQRWLPPLAVAASFALIMLVPNWLASPPTAGAADPQALAELRALDRSLQSAYLHQARGAEVETLLQARQQLAARLQPGAPVPKLVQL